MSLSEKYLATARLPQESTEEAVTRLAIIEQAKNAELQNAQLTIVKTKDIPVDYSLRNQWRLQGTRCIVDTTLPIIQESQSIQEQLADMNQRLSALEPKVL
jgi:hypothetical protein